MQIMETYLLQEIFDVSLENILYKIFEYVVLIGSVWHILPLKHRGLIINSVYSHLSSAPTENEKTGQQKINLALDIQHYKIHNVHVCGFQKHQF